MADPKILFKRTSTGAIQLWSQEIHPDGDKYRTCSGQKDGVIVESAWTQCESKNVGRANETTPQAQCEFEVAANYTKKLAQGGYHEAEKDIDKPKYFKPMLAKSLDDYPLTETAFNRGIVYWQPKLDGARSTFDETGSWSRNGKPFYTVGHLQNAIREFTAKDFRFDGELYNHALKADFNKIMSLIKQQPPKPDAPQKKQDEWLESLHNASQMVEYHVYDLPSVTGPFSERTEKLAEIIKQIGHPQIVYVRTEKPKNQAEVDSLSDQAQQDGYEGAIIRIDGYEYEQKRTKNLLKIKTFIDEEYSIVDIEEGTGNWAGAAKGVWFSTKDKKPFKATMMGTREYCRGVFENKNSYIGCEATVKRSKDLTPDGIPRWGSVKIIHDGKRTL